MKRLLISLSLLAVFNACHAQAINLECEDLVNRMVQRMAGDGLLAPKPAARRAALDIGIASCKEAQELAESQHEEAKNNALQNWIFENKPDKPGNRRLRNLK